MPIVAHPLWALEIIRPGIHWAPIVRLSTSWTDNRNWHVGKRVETHRPGREPGRDHPASIWAPSDNIGHCKTSGRRLNRVDLNHLLIKNESSVREILGRHRSVMHRERFQRCRGGLGLHRMPREVRGFGGCTGEHKRNAREHNQIFPHGILLSHLQENNAPAALPAVTGITMASRTGRKIDARVMRITSCNPRIWSDEIVHLGPTPRWSVFPELAPARLDSFVRRASATVCIKEAAP